MWKMGSRGARPALNERGERLNTFNTEDIESTEVAEKKGGVRQMIPPLSMVFEMNLIRLYLEAGGLQTMRFHWSYGDGQEG